MFWYTGYDWYDPLNAEDERRLASYLDGGGRILLSSQDYLYRRGESDFRVDRLGVLTYTADITAFAVSGVVNGVVGAQIGTAPLNPPYPEWSDVITPTASATTQLRNRDGGTIAVARYDETNHGKSFFLAFPFDGLDRRPAGELLGSIMGWFGGLAASSFTVERAWVESGAEIGFSLTVVNSGLQPASVSVTNELPSGLRLQAATLRGGTTDLKGGVAWSGSIAPGASQVITYRARLEPGFVGTAVNAATIESPGQTPIVLRTSVAVPYRYFAPIVLAGGS
ncbi:MAG: DUF11 domain-containing protein [Thermomicrobiales bacterium]|nr:DUF11 domain-containing protein [Thermomicrobiales bacterium]